MKIIVDNLATEYLDEGEGPVMLLLHGWGNTLHYFDTLCAELRGFRLVRLDAPGFGGSEIPKHAWDVERYAKFVDAFCKKIGIEPSVIVGHSFGGRIAVKGVSGGILHPDKIVLIAAAGVAERHTPRNLLYAAISKLGRPILSPLPAHTFQKIRAGLYRLTKSDYLTVGAMSPTFLNMIREDLSDDAAQVTTPTLLIWGKHDIVTPLREGEKLHRLIQGSRLEVLPHAGHFVYREHPTEVANLIRAFVS